MVAHREPLRLRVGDAGEALRSRRARVAALGGAEVAGDALARPVEVVGGRDVREEVVALLVAEVQGGLDESRGLDDDGRLAVRALLLDEPGNGFQAQVATSRSS